MSGNIEFHRAGEWTGVYLDGVLVCHGDHYHADEWLQERAGVTVVDSDAWIPDGYTPLRTLAEVGMEQERRDQIEQEVRHKRAEAARLEAEAAELEEKIRPPRQG